MTNFEKLCETAGIKLEYRYFIKGREITIENCDKNSIISLFSKPKKSNFKVIKADKNLNFTAEKQIELIKLIISDGTLIPLHLITEGKENTYIIGCYGGDYYGKNPDFPEALAGLALQLIEAGELNKEAVRKVSEKIAKEPIIVDGVDVSGCEFWKNYCRIAALPDFTGHICELNPSCYYKQLQRMKNTLDYIKEIAKNAYYKDLSARDCIECDTSFGLIIEKTEEILKNVQ